MIAMGGGGWGVTPKRNAIGQPVKFNVKLSSVLEGVCFAGKKMANRFTLMGGGGSQTCDVDVLWLLHLNQW